jgi:hypothetical protein
MRLRLHGIIIVGTVCFLIGWVVTRPIVSYLQADIGVFASPAPQSSGAASYESYALLLMDDYDRPQPIVEAVWLAHVPSDNSAIDLSGLPPAPFRDQFSPALNGVPLLTLQPYLRGRLVGTIVFDHQDVIELVERLGGAHVLGLQMDGEALLAYMDSPGASQAPDRLMRQAAVIQSLLAEMAALDSQLDLAGLIQTPSYSSVEQNKLYELVLHYYPVRTDLVRVNPAMELISDPAD